VRANHPDLVETVVALVHGGLEVLLLERQREYSRPALRPGISDAGGPVVGFR
jgi:hypothetical protein